ncbi:hypothetical protein LX32DRAFT_688714 [Colletotrichum zoysiae]|uniref:Uncharacterized protein n=1 Tax=Colletotrichum zoysiae TaxID=1216348 RepID=A0AAD9M5I6_9PEZI|nr:hypothetical protein LX32DRAFT_688714 [Colletotrichum zoysiae]
MVSSPTTAANATDTSLLSITTPWVQPPDCETYWSTTTSWRTVEDPAEPWVLTVSAPAASCNPSGWDRFGPESRLHFSPGVCPEGWLYHTMAERGLSSTALCCQSGFNNAGYYGDVTLLGSRNCVKYGWVTEYDSAASVQTSRHTAIVHEAWEVTWAASDTATLTPKLPTLTSYMVVPTWTPGEYIPDGYYDPKPQDHLVTIDEKALWFLIIGMPIIGALMIGSCIWCCVRSCKKKRRAKKASMATQSTLTRNK